MVERWVRIGAAGRPAWPALMAAALSACTVSHRMEPIGSGTTAVCEARHAGEGREVRWFGPEREGDRNALEAWCLAVGPVEVRSLPDAHDPSTGEGFGLTVVTWNVHVGGGDLPGFLGSELGYNCRAEGPPPSAGHFVLLLQEAHRASAAVPAPPPGAIVSERIAENPPVGPRFDIVEVAERCGLALFYVPSMRNGEESGEDVGEDRGSAILSSLPLSELAAIEVPLEAQRRVAVVASVPGPDGSALRLVNVHYDVASNILRVLATGGSMRVRQNDGLTEALDVMDPERAAPVVVAGDLNTWSSEETVIQRMLQVYPDSPDPGREKTRGDWPPDHLFFRAGSGPFGLVDGSYRVVADEYGSDHRARLVIVAPRDSAEATDGVE